MQPYKKGGRFYNDKHDSILRRLKNFMRGLFYVTGHHMLALFKKQAERPDVSRAGESTFVIPEKASAQAGPKVSITWLGHSTFLIQVAGINIITDPIFSGSFPVFSRKTPLPIAPEQLPQIDVVLISHNHKDHLDVPSLKILKHHDPLFLVPEGNSRLLKRYGCERVVEKTWWESEVVDTLIGSSLKITFLPAIHWASRGIFDVNTTLWGSWLIEGAGQKIYFAGDTAYGDHFSLIAQRYGPIDIALMPIGPNEPRQFIAEAHINAAEAVQAFIDLRAQHFVPMHWGTFGRMGAEVHDNPIRLLKKTWEDRRSDLVGTRLHVVTCGESRRC